MKGSSQGSAYPGHSSTHSDWVSRKHPVNCGDAEASWACRERGITAEEVCPDRQRPHVSGAALGQRNARPRVAPARARGRDANVLRAAFSGGEITLEYACSRSARAEARTARRQWIERAGESSAELPMWTSRDGWTTEVSAWLATDEGMAECRRIHIKPELVLRIAMVLAAHADHGTGRHCAVTNATVARGANCSQRSVSTVRKILATSALAVLIRQGHGSPDSARGGWRPAVWHLVSRRNPVDKPAARDADLRPTAIPEGDRRSSLVKDQSPSARDRASTSKSDPCTQPPRRGRGPRPLAIQRLADELIGNRYGRTPLLQGLYRGHIGAICDAIMAAGIDPEVWSAQQIKAALNADMKARHRSWPDRIERPAAFLASRLRHLPVRPDDAVEGAVTESRVVLSSRAAAEHDRAGESQSDTQARTQRWYADVRAATTPQQRQTVLHAHETKFGPATDPFAALANAGRRAARLFPTVALTDGLMQWAGDVLGDEPATTDAERTPEPTSLSTDLLMNLAIGNCNCAVCGAPNAIERPQLPLKAMSTVCDQCWPVIAAELTLASEEEEGLG
ncbi:hypothetical protein FIV07_27660 (plasmid) [Mycobacterium sp. THAF192]|nr:hypothetical protein FIV07_27660 [Mycobacterium sp. THAF192]